MLSQIEVVIIAGGLGTRLQTVLPPGQPKVLAPIGGQPFLRLLVDRLYHAGIRRILLALGYGAEAVHNFLHGQAWPAELELREAVEPVQLGTGGALRYVLPQLGGRTFIAVNGDTIADVDLDRMLDFHHRHGARITMALAAVTDTSRYGRVTADAEGRVIAFSEKVPQVEGAGHINAGIYVIEREVVEAIPTDRATSWERDMLPRYCNSGLYAFPGGGLFIDIGTPVSLKAAANLFADIVSP